MSEGQKRSGVLGLITSNMDTILALAKVALPASFTGALVGLATWFAGLFQQFAPASWVIAGVLGALVGALIVFFIAVARERLQVIRFRNSVFSISQVNPLDPMFNGKRLRLVDLVPPVGPFIEGKTFVDCELIGPANVMFQGCVFYASGGEIVDGIVIKAGFKPRNGIGFKNCTFTRCRFYLMTFMVPEPEFDFFYNGHPGLNWITEKPNEPPLPMKQVQTEPQEG